MNRALGVKKITITEEAYKMLAKEKKENESFSEVIKRLIKDRGRLSDSFGAWKMSDAEAREIFSNLRRRWKESTSRLQRRTQRS